MRSLRKSNRFLSNRRGHGLSYIKLFFILLMVLFHLIEFGHILNQPTEIKEKVDLRISKNKMEEAKMKVDFKKNIAHTPKRIKKALIYDQGFF